MKCLIFLPLSQIQADGIHLPVAQRNWFCEQVWALEKKFGQRERSICYLTAIRFIRSILAMRITITNQLTIDTNTRTSTLKLISSACWCSSWINLLVEIKSTIDSSYRDSFVHHCYHNNHQLWKKRKSKVFRKEFSNKNDWLPSHL